MNIEGVAARQSQRKWLRRSLAETAKRLMTFLFWGVIHPLMTEQDKYSELNPEIADWISTNLIGNKSACALQPQ